MHWGALGILVGGVTVVWGSAFLVWRWSRKRLGLDAPDAPGMGQRERTVRRSLRALLAFDFFVMWPFGVPTCVILPTLAFEHREMLGPSLAALLGFVGFTVAVPSLIRTARQLEQQRLSGQPDTVPPSFWIEGGAALTSRQGTGAARWGRYAIVAVLLAVSVFNWKMTLVVIFYAGIAAAAWFGWIWLTRRWRS